MEEGFEKNEKEREEIFSRAVKAGKRTYFFDVKLTRNNDLYLTVTESKKRFLDEGKFVYEKHKLFLYKEDFEKFIDGFEECIDYIKKNSPEKPEEVPSNSFTQETSKTDNSFTNVNFEDLDK